MEKLQLVFQSPSVRSFTHSENSLVYRETHCLYIGEAAAAVGTAGQSRAPHGSDGTQGNCVLGEAGEVSLLWQSCPTAEALTAKSRPVRPVWWQLQPGPPPPHWGQRAGVNTSKWILLPNDIPAMLTEWRSPSSSWCFYRPLNKMHKYSLELGLQSRLFLYPGVNNPPCHSHMVNIPQILNTVFWSCTRWEDASSLA